MRELQMARYFALIGVACASLALSQTADAQPTQEGQHQKEIELLKREIELLKRENELLKREIELLKKGGGKGEAPATAKMTAKGTLDGVRYEVTKTEMDGPVWWLTLTAISEDGDKTVFFAAGRGLTQDGRMVVLGRPGNPSPKVGGLGGKMQNPLMPQGAVRIPEGVKVQIRLRMGRLPGRITAFERVELFLPLGRGPLLLKNVKVGP
jgi:hypothetical protein